MPPLHSHLPTDGELFGSQGGIFEIRLHDRTLLLRRPLLVGVLNLTPDSFSDGGSTLDRESALAAAQRLILEGADVLDIGAESSRPGAEPVSAEEEIRRLQEVVPAVLALGVPVSIDTYKPQVADLALNWGVHLINDISGLKAPMLEVATRHRCPVIVMHMAGTPPRMQQSPSYQDVVEEVYDLLETRIAAARGAGVEAIADIGFGFGKTLENNLELLRALPRFHALGVPLLLGTSRKSTLGALTGQGVQQRLEGTLATAAWALERGVQLLRVHDVAAHRQLLQVTSALSANSPANQPPTNTTIRLDGISAKVHLGVPDTERAVPQTVLIDLEFEIAYRSNDDHIQDTVDYSGLPQRIQQLCVAKPFKLLETLAGVIGRTLLKELAVHHLTVRIHKPAAAANIGCKDVVLERRFERASLARKNTAFIALGSNLGDRKAFLHNAIAELRRLGIVEAVSPWIETLPEGGASQPKFLNGVVRIRTFLSPHELLQELLEIERRFGRHRGATQQHGAPRTLDLDLLLYEDLIINTEDLQVPHPRLHLRRFVLTPLVAIAPEALHPTLQRTAAELQADLSGSSPMSDGGSARS